MDLLKLTYRELTFINYINRRLNLIRCWLENQYGLLWPPSPKGCVIDWQPHALAPVFYGVRDYGWGDGAPGPCRVFFPSLDGSPQTANVLKGCGPYPLILFVHGQCEMDSEHYKKWFMIPATLARAGYVVVVPEIPHTRRPLSEPHEGIQRIGEIVDWMRECWRHRDVLRPRYAGVSPPGTGVAGHSWGAILAARFAAENDVSAYAALSGSWGDFQDTLEPIMGLGIPTFFSWGVDGVSVSEVHSNLTDGEWASLSEPKHKATFDGGEHWDYLPPDQTRCEMSRGSCNLTHWLAMDLITMFFGRYLAREDSPTLSEIPGSLIPPDYELTDEQYFFAGAYLQGFSRLASDSECQVTLTWETDMESGTSTLPE